MKSRTLRHFLPALLLPALLLAAALGAPESAAAAKKPKQLAVAILDLEPIGAPAELSRNLTALLASEVGRYHDIAPITRREVASLLDYDRQRQMLSCSDDSCLAQVVGALGVEKLLSGQVGQVENSYVLTLHLIDVRSAKVERRVSRVVPTASNRLVDSVKSAVIELIGPHASAQNQAPRLALARSMSVNRADRVSLDASRCYDPDGDPLEISWRQVAGPAALLEGQNLAQASFVAHEEGHYTFAVSISDGRAPAQEELVAVEVLPRRRFLVGLGYKHLLSFNRIVDPHEGDVFRNRAPPGAVVLLGFKLSERWTLVGEGALSYMYVFPEGVTAQRAKKSVEVYEPSVMLGARYRFPFDGFDFWASASVGTSRLYITARDDTTGDNPDDTKIREQCVVGEVAAAVDLPFGERFGLLVQGGLMARAGTDKIGTLQNSGLHIARNGFLWGINGMIAPYFRL